VIKTRSVMGTEIPLVEYEPKPARPTYAYYNTRASLDEARAAFEKVKKLSIELSMIENAAIRLASNIKKTQTDTTTPPVVMPFAFIKLIKPTANSKRIITSNSILFFFLGYNHTCRKENKSK